MSRLFVLTALWFGGSVILHLLFVRVVCRRAFVRNGYLFALVMGIIPLPVVARLGLLPLAFAGLTFIVLWNLYTIFFINLMNSVSLRMMLEIERAPAQSLAREELLAVYSDEDAFASRVRGLAATGLLSLHGEELILTGRGRRFAGLLRAIRRLFGIEIYG